MSEKLSDQNVRLKLSFGDFKLSVEASESFVKHALRDCLDDVLDANIFEALEETPNQIESAYTIEASDEIVSKDPQIQTEYSMNSMVNLLFGNAKVSVSKVIQAAFVWLEVAERNSRPSFDEVRECFSNADDYLTSSQVRNFTRDFGVMKKAGKILELNGQRFKLDRPLSEELKSKIANAE